MLQNGGKMMKTCRQRKRGKEKKRDEDDMKVRVINEPCSCIKEQWRKI